MTTSAHQFDNDIFTFDSDEEQQVQDNLQDLPYQTQHSIKQTNTEPMALKHPQLQITQNNVFFFQENDKDWDYMEKRGTTMETKTQIIDIKPKTKNTDAMLNTKSVKMNHKHALNKQFPVNSKPSLSDNPNFQQFLEKQNTTLPHPPTYSIQGAKILDSDSNHQMQYQYIEEQKAIKVTNLKQFLFSQLSPQCKVNILIKKVDEGFFGKIVNKTKYYVTIEQNNKFLFSVTKEGLNKLIFSMSKDDPTPKNKNYLGQLIGKDFYNTQFLLFDDGFDPQQTKSLQFSYKQLAWVKYEQTSGPRKFNVTISTNNKGFHCIEKDVNIIEKKWSQNKDRKSLCRLQSKVPVLDESDGNFKLDFKGMIGKPSIKNFVIDSEQFDDSLIFARRNDDTYGVEIKHPFSLVQAVGVCMTSIYHKVVF